MDAIAVIIVLAILGFGLYGLIHSSHDSWSPRSGAQLQRDASIVSIDTKRYNKYKFKTTVQFSDGFCFYAFDTDSRASGFNRTTIRVTPEMRMEIAERAIAKHNALLDR